MSNGALSSARELASKKIAEIASRHVIDRWEALAEQAILVLGSPRSGTSWLAKIFDSHPDILYRHEPDELTLDVAGVNPRAQLVQWIKERGLRAAAKRPWFAKSWRPRQLALARTGLASCLAAAQRFPLTSRAAALVGLPDLIAPNAWHRVRAAIKLVNWDGSAVARTMPGTRCVFIVRHPCGQAASVKAGQQERWFPASGSDLDPGQAWAARNGVNQEMFARLPPVARIAWAWRAFNEPALESMTGLPNVRVLVYEDLCRAPEQASRDLFGFAGLSWNPQTAAFLRDSTRHGGGSGYFDVYRATSTVPDRWRQTMPLSDQEAVRSVMLNSPLAKFWSDLAPA